jgi:C-terminal processing protease CtpA/Prc
MNLQRDSFCPKAIAVALSLAFLLVNRSSAQQQKIDPINAQRVQEMLRVGYDEVHKNYYDKNFHGLDWDSQFHLYNEKMKQINSLGQGFSLVAGMMMLLNDSHTFFIPPSRPIRVEYGFHIQMVGDRAFITNVRPDSDAASKVHPGDEVIAYNRYNVTRDSLWKMNYYYNRLSPLPGSQLVLKDPAGQQREEKVEAKVQQLKRVLDLTQGNDIWQLIRESENADHQIRQRYVEMGDAMFWKMPEFDLNDSDVDHLFSIAHKHKALVLDMRQNPGGAVVTLERMLGNVFDHDVKIADRIGRKDLKPQLAKTRGKNIYDGKIIVLVDSVSASAAELFARVVQLENRGTVIGDRSSGSVMESRHYSESQGADSKIFYSFSITDADLIMKDGKSLEHSGVTPDEIVLPTARDLADSKDPVLARAAELAGIHIDPGQAGKMFPYEWLPMAN